MRCVASRRRREARRKKRLDFFSFSLYLTLFFAVAPRLLCAARRANGSHASHALVHGEEGDRHRSAVSGGREQCAARGVVPRVRQGPAGGDQFGEHVNVRKYKKNVFFVAKNVENYPPINILVYVIIFLLQPNFFQDDEEIFGCAEPVEEVQAELCERNREDNKLSHETDPRFRVLLVDSVSRFMFFCGDKATFL
jgi:hypothetical protein